MFKSLTAFVVRCTAELSQAERRFRVARPPWQLDDAVQTWLLANNRRGCATVNWLFCSGATRLHIRGDYRRPVSGRHSGPIGPA